VVCAHRRQSLGDPPLYLPFREAEVARPKRNILKDSRHEELIVSLLKDNPDGSPHGGQGLAGYRQVPYTHLTLRGEQASGHLE